jgi:hypothetical protein
MNMNSLLRRLATAAAFATATLSLGFGQPPPPGADAGPPRTPEELDQIFAPIALYPDALVALILPATTAPADVASAAAFLSGGGDSSQLAGQPWQDSVKSLAHYPAVVAWLSDNGPWMQQAATAFVTQPQDVMKSIQQLRARAVAAGSLTSNAQQEVVMDSDGIRIIPAQANVIYVPSYDPEVVYEERPGFAGPWLTFGLGYPEGLWLNYDLDWDNYGIWIGAWRPGWDYRHPGWRGLSGRAFAAHSWQASSQVRARAFTDGRVRSAIVRPGGFPGAPGRPAQARAARPDGRASAPAYRPDARGYPAATSGRAPILTRPAPAPSSVFGGYNRGSDARAASQRGQSSRQAPARAPARAPAQRPSAPAPRGNSGGSDRDRK